MKEKSELVDKLKLFLAETKTLGHVVKVLITDNGTEYCNFKVSEVLGEYGIQHRKTMPYTPEQNGSSERENRTLVESARTMIHAASLPTELWAEAVNTAAFVINRTGPSNVSGKTPFQLWYGKEAPFKHIKIFGTECFVHVPQPKRKKWDKKSIKGKLVGYVGDRDGFRIWIPEKQDIIVSRDVTFKQEDKQTITDVNGAESEVKTKTVMIESKQNDSPDNDIQEENNNTETEERQANASEKESDSDGAFEFEDDNNHENEQTHEVHVGLHRSYGDHQLRNRADLSVPSYLQDYALLTKTPTTYEEAMNSEDRLNWNEAIKEEIQSLINNDTWDLLL
jgi:hypothetical protein